MKFFSKLFGKSRSVSTGSGERESVSASEAADALWETIENWPSKYGKALKQDFPDSFGRDFASVFEEIVYYNYFCMDLSLHVHAKTRPTVSNTIRDALTRHLRTFASSRARRPVPKGMWFNDSSLIWMSVGDSEGDKSCDPVDSLNERFTLYGQALKRCPDRPRSEALAHLLAGLCGTTDIAFIAYAIRLFEASVESVRGMFKNFDVV